MPSESTFCFQCGGKVPAATTASPKEVEPGPVPRATPIAPEVPVQAPTIASDGGAPSPGGRSKLGDDVGALGCSVLLVFVGGGLAVMEGKWGTWALVVGGLIGVVGLITGNATFWAILKRLGKRDK